MKKAEIEHHEMTKSSLRISNKRAVQGGRLSAITMALQYGSESEEDAALAAARYEEGSLKQRALLPLWMFQTLSISFTTR